MQCAGGYSSHRGMFGCGGNTQINNILVVIACHTVDWNAGSLRAEQVSGSGTIP